MTVQRVLIDGQWTTSAGTSTFHAVNPRTKEPLPDKYPVSPWAEVVKALDAASRAAETVRSWSGERFAAFLDRFADRIDARAAELIEIAHLETALPVTPRLKDAELPRTSNQLRQAAKAARDGSWAMPTIDAASNIRSVLSARSSARRAAEGSPRRKPWGERTTACFSPEGGTPNDSAVSTNVTPSGLPMFV